MKPTPYQSLRAGHWFKLICGASYQHLPAIRNLSLVYTLVGADCIDVAPDPAVITTAREGITAALTLKTHPNLPLAPSQVAAPWLMVSLNAGEDPHFRKAVLSPAQCPTDCSQPCVTVCPAQAIAFPHPEGTAGVLSERCYGCGRCLPLCPIEQITTQAHAASPQTILPLLSAGHIDALEIHTQVGQLAQFQTLWRTIVAGVKHLKILAISCPDGDHLLGYLATLHRFISPLPCPLIWQVDGRPMSGDIGKGTTMATIRLGKKVLQSQLPGFVQLAGGTNGHTVAKLKAIGLLHPNGVAPDDDFSLVQDRRWIAGIAYGSYARCLLDPVWMALETQSPPVSSLEASPQLLQQAVNLAQGLIGQLKPSLKYREVDVPTV